jgi:hypothetical protein
MSPDIKQAYLLNQDYLFGQSMQRDTGARFAAVGSGPSGDAPMKAVEVTFGSRGSSRFGYGLIWRLGQRRRRGAFGDRFQEPLSVAKRSDAEFLQILSWIAAHLGQPRCHGRVPLMPVAKNLGHTSTRMVEAQYGHFANDFATQAIRAMLRSTASPMSRPRAAIRRAGGLRWGAAGPQDAVRVSDLRSSFCCRRVPRKASQR